MWKVIGASVAGTAHQATGRQCEDACGWRAAAEVTCLAVAILTGSAVAVGQIGDTIAVAGRAGSYQTLTPAPRAEYVNETAFLTGPDALGELRINVTPAARADTVFLATDGLRFKILDDLTTAAPFTPFFEDLAAFARSSQASDDAVRAFLADLDDQSGDDKTLLAAVRG